MSPGAPTTCWSDYVSQLDWKNLCAPPEELEELARESRVWVSLLGLLPRCREAAEDGFKFSAVKTCF